MAGEEIIRVEGLEMAYGDLVVQRNLNFSVHRGEVFIVMGGSGCGKSTLLRHLVGLKEPAAGRVSYQGVSYWEAEPSKQLEIMRRFGVHYQKGALWSSMTLAENIALPLEEYTKLSAPEIEDIVHLKLALVGLSGFEDYYPAEISGGMEKRAALARAIALDPEIVFFDEPSAGLDPISSKRLDDLIKELSESLGTTVVIVTHELPSILSIGTNSVFLDADAKTMLATGHPHDLLEHCSDPRVQAFLRRQPGARRTAKI